MSDLLFVYDIVRRHTFRSAFQTGQRAATLTAEERSDRSAATGELKLMVPERQCGVRLRVTRAPRARDTLWKDWDVSPALLEAPEEPVQVSTPGLCIADSAR